MRWFVLMVSILCFALLGACDSKKEQEKTGKDIVKSKPVDQVAGGAISTPEEKPPADALAKVGNKYIMAAEYDKQAAKFSPKLAETEHGRRYIVNQYVESILIEKESEERAWTKDPALRMKIEDYARSLYRETLLKSVREGQPQVTNEVAKKYFEEHEEEFVVPDRVRVSLIEVGMDQDKDIQNIYKELKAGKDFAQVAMNVSKHPSAKQGGDLNFVTAKQYKHLTDVGFSLKEGEISKPFKSPFGWDIIKVTGFAKKQPIPIEEGIKRAKARLEAVEAAKAFDILMKGLREKHKVMIYEDRIGQLGAAPGAAAQTEPAQKGK